MDPLTSAAATKVVSGAIGQQKEKKAGRAQAAIGIGYGLTQLMEARKARKAAKGFTPELVDPNRAAFMAEIDQKRRSMETGAEFAGMMDEIDQSQASANDAIVSVTGGDSAGTIDALLKSQRVADQGVSQALATGAQNQLAYTGLANSVGSEIAQRKMDLQLEQRRQALAEWAQARKNADASILAGASYLVGGGKGAAKPKKGAGGSPIGVDFTAPTGNNINNLISPQGLTNPIG